jgi:hypothetical protein
MNEQTEEVVAPVVEAPQYATIKRGVFVGANDRMCQVVDLGDIDNTGSDVTGIMIQRLGHKPQRILMTQKMWDMLSEAMYLFSCQDKVEGKKDYYIVNDDLYDGDVRKKE